MISYGTSSNRVLTSKSDQHLISLYNITPRIKIVKEMIIDKKLLIVKQIFLVNTLGNV